MDSTSERLIGEVTASKPDRGFAFVQIDNGSQSFFLHFKHIKDGAIPKPGDLFTFLVRETPNRPGTTEAYDAHLVKRANLKASSVVSLAEVQQ
jgi:cold shock CspA family protein